MHDTWNAPDYWQTDNSNGPVMVIRNYHWLNSTSRVLISICSAPLVQTGECKQFSLFNLDLWPTTLTYNARIATVKVDPHAKNQGQTVQTGECPQQTNTHAHTWMLPNVLSPLLRVDNYTLTVSVFHTQELQNRSKIILYIPVGFHYQGPGTSYCRNSWESNIVRMLFVPCCTAANASDFMAVRQWFRLQIISEYETVLVLRNHLVHLWRWCAKLCEPSSFTAVTVIWKTISMLQQLHSNQRRTAGQNKIQVITDSCAIIFQQYGSEVCLTYNKQKLFSLQVIIKGA